MQRRLAAIVAADMVGYSAMMNADSEGTLDALRDLRTNLFGPIVNRHRGKVVKSMGDGWLVEFSSSADAVSCAMQVQDSLITHPTIKLRIGIHIGDIVHEDDDIFGDGVNIAARLEALAEPGGILVSDAVFGSLDGTLRPSFDDTGSRELKNIDHPVKVWARADNSESSSYLKLPDSSPRSNTGYPMLSIRPLSTSDARPEVQELAEALGVDVLAYIGSLRWIHLSAGETSKTDSYVLSWALRARNDRLRLEMQLMDEAGERVLIEKFDGNLTDSFDWQDEIGEQVADQVIGMILDIEKQKLSRKSVDEMSAVECNLRGLIEVELTEKKSTAGALLYQAAAVEKDPDFVEALADAILMAISTQSAGYADVREPYNDRYSQWIRKARETETRSPMLSFALALDTYNRTGNQDELRRAIRDALRRNPFSPEVIFFAGFSYVWMGEPEPALDCFRKGERLMRFNPYFVPLLGGMGIAYVQAGHDLKAIKIADQGLELTKKYPTLYRVIAAANAHLGRFDEAKAALIRTLELMPDDRVSVTRDRSGYADTPESQRYLEGLRLAGMPE